MPAKFCKDCSQKIGFFKKKYLCHLCMYHFCERCFSNVKRNEKELTPKIFKFTSPTCLKCIVFHNKIKREHLFLLTNKHLTEFLTRRHISIVNCKEKYHLVDLIMDFAQTHGQVCGHDIESEVIRKEQIEKLREDERLRKAEEDRLRQEQEHQDILEDDSLSEVDQEHNSVRSQHQTIDNTDHSGISQQQPIDNSDHSRRTQQQPLDNTDHSHGTQQQPIGNTDPSRRTPQQPIDNTDPSGRSQEQPIDNSDHSDRSEEQLIDNTDHFDRSQQQPIDNTDHFDNISTSEVVENLVSEISQNIDNNRTTDTILDEQSRHEEDSSSIGENSNRAGSLRHHQASGLWCSVDTIKHEQDIRTLTVLDLKQILVANFIDFRGCVEKNELIEKVKWLYKSEQQSQDHQVNDPTAYERDVCKICMDHTIDCVLLDCGHLVACHNCGKRLSHCPICRSMVVRVVHVFRT